MSQPGVNSHTRVPAGMGSSAKTPSPWIELGPTRVRTSSTRRLPVPDLVVLAEQPGEPAALDRLEPVDELVALEPARRGVVLDEVDVDALPDQRGDVLGQARRLRLRLVAEAQPGGVLPLDRVVDRAAAQEDRDVGA